MRGPALAALLLLAALPAIGQTRRGLTGRGLDSLRQATLVDSVDAESYYAHGLGLWERRQFDAADTAFRKALRFAPWHAGSHLALGVLPFARGDRYLFDLRYRLPQDSLRAFFQGTARHTRDAYVSDPLVDLAPLRFLKDDELVPDGGGLMCMRGLCFVMSRDSRWLRPLRRAGRFLVTGRADSAYAILEAAMATRTADQTLPDDFVRFYALSADRAGHPDRALEGYRELAQRAGRREAGAYYVSAQAGSRDLYLVLYGMAAERTGRSAIARAALREALTVDLTIYQAHARLADIAESAGEVEEAIAERRAAIAMAPDIGRLYLDLGITLLQSGRTTEAKDALAEAAVHLPWDAGTQLFLFQAALATQDRPTAARALAALELFAPRRNAEQVAEARRRLAELP